MTLGRAQCFVIATSVVFASACGDTGSSGATQSASAAIKVASAAPSAPASSSATARKPREEFRGGGPTAMLFHAANSLELKDAQKTDIAKLEATLHADDNGPKTEWKDMSTDLVAQVKAGKIDAAKLEPRFTAIDKAIQAHQQKEADALNGLYALLDPTQRKAAVADARAKVAAREEHMEQKKEEHADKDKDAGAGSDWAKMKLEHLTKDLDLDATQQKTVEGFLAKSPDAKTTAADKHAERKKETEALFAAFEADGFDAKKLDMFSATPKEKPRDPFDHEVQFLTQLLPVLKPDQRDKLAAKMEARTSPHPGRPDMMGPMWPSLFEDGHGDMPHGDMPHGDMPHPDMPHP